MALVALVAAPMASANSCSAKKADSAEKAACSSKAEKASATAGKDHCSKEDIEACAKKLGITVEECKAMFADGKHAMKTISIEGMTCGSCENSVKGALEKVDGVLKVVSISHKEKKAVVCIDPAKCSTEALTKAVTAKGYKAAVVTADAKTAPEGHGSKSGCSKSCSDKEKAACSAKEKAACEDKKAEKAEKEKGDL